MRAARSRRSAAAASSRASSRRRCATAVSTWPCTPPRISPVTTSTACASPPASSVPTRAMRGSGRPDRGTRSRPGARVATASIRRVSQLLRLRPDLQIEPVRGNVDTRLRKRAERGLDAVILAAAGLDRLALADQIGFRIEPGEMPPESGQGIVVLQVRAGEEAPRGRCRPCRFLARAACRTRRHTRPRRRAARCRSRPTPRGSQTAAGACSHSPIATAASRSSRPRAGIRWRWRTRCSRRSWDAVCAIGGRGLESCFPCPSLPARPGERPGPSPSDRCADPIGQCLWAAVTWS